MRLHSRLFALCVAQVVASVLVISESRIARAQINVVPPNQARIAAVAVMRSGSSTYADFCTPDGQITVVITPANTDANYNSASFGNGAAYLQDASGGEYHLNDGNASIQSGCYRLKVANSTVTGDAFLKITVWYNPQTTARASSPQPTPFHPASSATDAYVNGNQLPQLIAPTPRPRPTAIHIPRPLSTPKPVVIHSCGAVASGGSIGQEAIVDSSGCKRATSTRHRTVTYNPTPRPRSDASERISGERASDRYNQQNQAISAIVNALFPPLTSNPYDDMVSANYRIPPPDFSEDDFSCPNGSNSTDIVEYIGKLEESYRVYVRAVNSDVDSYNNDVQQIADLHPTQSLYDSEVADAKRHLDTSLADDDSFYKDQDNSYRSLIRRECQRLAQVNASTQRYSSPQFQVSRQLATGVTAFSPAGAAYTFQRPRGWTQGRLYYGMQWVDPSATFTSYIALTSQPFAGTAVAYMERNLRNAVHDIMSLPRKTLRLCAGSAYGVFTTYAINGGVSEDLYVVLNGTAFEVQYFHGPSGPVSASAERSLRSFCPKK